MLSKTLLIKPVVHQFNLWLIGVNKSWLDKLSVPIWFHYQVEIKLEDKRSMPDYALVTGALVIEYSSCEWSAQIQTYSNFIPPPLPAADGQLARCISNYSC